MLGYVAYRALSQTGQGQGQRQRERFFADATASAAQGQGPPPASAQVHSTAPQPLLREHAQEQAQQQQQDDKWKGISVSTAWVIFGLTIFLWVVLGGLAVYLSWTSNRLIGWNVAYCLLFAVFAALFETSYIVTHLVNKLDLLVYIRMRLPQAQVPAQVQAQAQAPYT
jgi:hypothetical protein